MFLMVEQRSVASQAIRIALAFYAEGINHEKLPVSHERYLHGMHDGRLNVKQVLGPRPRLDPLWSRQRPTTHPITRLSIGLLRIE